MNPIYAWLGIAISAISMIGTVVTAWIVLRIRVELLEVSAGLLREIEHKYATRESVDLRFGYAAERLTHLEASR